MRIVVHLKVDVLDDDRVFRQRVDLFAEAGKIRFKLRRIRFNIQRSAHVKKARFIRRKQFFQVALAHTGGLHQRLQREHIPVGKPVHGKGNSLFANRAHGGKRSVPRFSRGIHREFLIHDGADFHAQAAQIGCDAIDIELKIGKLEIRAHRFGGSLGKGNGR